MSDPAPSWINPVEIARLASKGLTAQEAADSMGFSLWSVRDNARQIGVTFRNPRGFTAEERAKIMFLHGEGWSLRRIAQEVGGSGSGVREVLLRDGAARSPRAQRERGRRMDMPESIEKGQIWKDRDRRSAGSGEFVVVAHQPGSDRALVYRKASGRNVMISVDRLLEGKNYEYIGKGR